MGKETNHSPVPDAGPRRPVLKDVCAAAGVSKATVSRVLNDKPVSPALRKKVLAAMKQLNYTPRAAARNLASAKTNTIGVVFQDLTSGWPLNIFRGVMHMASTAGYNVISALSTTVGDELLLPKRLLAEGHVDGLVWFDPRVPDTEIKRMTDQRVPFVLIQRTIEDPAVNFVCIENADGGRQGVAHLLALGYRRLMLITGQEDNVDSNERLDGAERALREIGAEVPADYRINGHFVGVHAVRAFASWVGQGLEMPDAIFAFNDDMAISVMHWLKGNGYRVPEDVAIVGYDGLNESEYLGLTTVETPMYETGVLGTQILLDLISGSISAQRARQVYLRGKLRVRESCGAKLKEAKE